ncbi:BMP family ABC transporter substrate-binding protein [Streptococcus agalactiae]|nr:hypothetical protein V193_04415 [Streptococcus agalactiae 138P]AHX74949.1 hypothetical protein DN94_04415 [Streptococcus agalactiae]AKU01713.1 hypothetical protein GX026_04445 [Streptococcus agalactiae]AWQ29288.1 BMP family ABC transporter substrate-binding protein [Streptococcus agalactiae]OVF12966.1 BMP family ABC transporter substrate-binding protein [Streptococcus agalactiae]
MENIELKKLAVKASENAYVPYSKFPVGAALRTAEGKYTSKDGKASNFVLASSIKEVGKSVELIATKTSKGKFPGGNVTTYGLKDGGVDIATTNLSDDAVKAIKEAKAKIISGDIKVPSK